MKLYHRLSAEDNMLTNHILNLFSDSVVRLISQSPHLADCRASKEKLQSCGSIMVSFGRDSWSKKNKK